MSRFICGVSGMYIGNPLGYSVSWDNEVFVWMTRRLSCDVVTLTSTNYHVDGRSRKETSSAKDYKLSMMFCGRRQDE